MIKGKKGDVTDTLMILIIIFFLAVSFIVVLYTNSKIQEVIDTTVLNQSAAYSSISAGLSYINSTVVQRGFVLFFAILCIGVVVSSFLVRVHPVFIFIYIIMLGFTVFVAVFLANSYQAVIENAELAVIAANQGMINYIMQNIIKIIIGVGALSMVIVFSKIFTGGGISARREDL